MPFTGRLPEKDRPGFVTWTVDDIAARDALTEVTDNVPITSDDIGRICRVGTSTPYTYYELIAVDPQEWTAVADLTQATADTLYEPKLQHNTTATSDPTVTDDSDAGYSVRSAWINTDSGEIFRCLDATAGAAVWANTTLTLDELGGLATIDDAPSDGDIYGREDGGWVVIPGTGSATEERTEFDEDSGSTTGLTWGYKAGSFRVGDAVYDLAAGDITLTDDATCYVYLDVFTQAVTHNTSGFPYGSIPLREVVTSSGSQASSDDKRAWLQHAAINDTLVEHGTVSSGTETVDYRSGKVHKIEAGGDFTLAHSNWPASGTPADMEIVAVNWGAHAVTLPGSWNWGDAGAPTFSSAGRDRIILRSDDGGTTVDAMLAGSGF